MFIISPRIASDSRAFLYSFNPYPQPPPFPYSFNVPTIRSTYGQYVLPHTFPTLTVHRPIPQLPLFNQNICTNTQQTQRVRPTESQPDYLPQYRPVITEPTVQRAPEKIEHKAREDSKEEMKSATPAAGKKSIEDEQQTAGGAYKRRNVYKSIVRHMFSYIRKNREEIIKILQEAGYGMSDIEHAFFEVSCYNDMEQQKGNKKQSQSTIKKMVETRSIYTYILRETLFAMIKSWEEGKHGKVSSKNLGTYKDVCFEYYNEAVQVLTQKAQGKTFNL